MRGEGRATGCACARLGAGGGVSRGRLKMAAPGATFRLLLPFRPLAAAVAVRAYGVRASGTGELITHTGQVRAWGRGRRMEGPRVGAAREGGGVRAASTAAPVPAGKPLPGLRAARW